MFVLLLVQIVAGTRATNRIIDNKTARFAVEYEFDEERAPLQTTTAVEESMMMSSVPGAVSRWGDVRAQQQQQQQHETGAFTDPTTAVSPSSTARQLGSTTAGGGGTSAIGGSPSRAGGNRTLSVPATPATASTPGGSSGTTTVTPANIRASAGWTPQGMRMSGTSEVELSRASSITSGALSQRRAEYARQLADKQD
jgi:hypothetical protein